MKTMLTIQDLKNRKSYIIAKFNRLGMSDQLVSCMGLMKSCVEQGYDGTVYELLMEVYNQLRTRSRKTTKVAEARARVAESTGIEQLSWAESKFGKQNLSK